MVGVVAAFEEVDVEVEALGCCLDFEGVFSVAEDVEVEVVEVGFVLGEKLDQFSITFRPDHFT